VNNLKEAIPPTSAGSPRRLHTRAAGLLALLGTGLLIAGCGSSSESSTITIGNESKADNALIKAGEIIPAKTPTSGPLATEPTLTASTGPAPTKLESKDLVVGTGAEAKKGSNVEVNYVGALFKTGKTFDASWLRKEPFLFVIGTGEVIAGWDQGVIGMKVGGRRELIIPSALGYGKNGNAPKIPKNEALKFVIDLLKVNS
jgi:peptidylprolyl isomerase